MEKWRTAIAHSDSTGIWIRGYDVTALMRGTFTDTIYPAPSRPAADGR